MRRSLSSHGFSPEKDEQMEKPVNDEPVQTEARHYARRSPSASNSITLRVLIQNKVGMIGEVLSSIGRAGGDVGAIDIVQVTGDAWPICLASKDPNEIVRAVKALAPGFGGINLEDIAAPHCFEIDADYIVASVFNRDVARRVAEAVMKAAVESGVAGRERLAGARSD
jgi:malic enzyme-like protein